MYKLLHRHYHKKYHLNYRHAKKLFFFDLMLLALAIFLFIVSAILFFWNPGLMDKVDLSIEINNTRIESGEFVCFNIKYGNKNTQALTNPIIGLEFPSGFIVDKNKTVENLSEHYTLNLPNLEPGGSGEFSVCGDLWVKPEQEEIINASLTYTPEETNYKEQKNTMMLLKLPTSVLKTRLRTPEKSLPSSISYVTYSIINEGNKVIDNIHLRNSLNLELENNFKLNPGETKEFSTRINIPSDNKYLNIEFISEVLVENKYIEQTMDEKNIMIVSPQVSISTNYGEPKQNYVEPGQSLPLQIKWSNESEYSFRNTQIELSFEPKIVDLETTAKLNDLKIVNGKLLIGPEKRTALSSATPGIKDSFSIELKLKSTFSLQNMENVYLETKPTLVLKLEDLNEQEYRKDGEGSLLPIVTDLSWDIETRYYTKEGDQLGRGPLPPHVGETTKYWILTKIWNTTNAVKNVNFSATLPAGVEFTDRQSVTIGPSISFDKNTNQINWSYSKLPPNSQTGLYFEVAITPTIEQIGKPIELVKNVKMTAIDDFTKKELSLVKDLLNNDLQTDDQGDIKGNKVVE